MMFHQKSSRTNHHESLWLATEELGPSPTILCASLVVLDLSLGRHEKDCDEIAAQSSGFVNPRFLLSVIPSEKLWNSHLLGTSSPFGVGIMSSPRPVSVRLAWILPISAAAWLWKFIYGTVVTSRFTVCFHCTGGDGAKLNPHQKSGEYAATVDGWNPAPVEVGSLSMYIPLFTRLYTSQVVVWDCFHQQYHWYMKKAS